MNYTKGSQVRNNFNSSLNKIKNPDINKLENEYVSTLQEEIKMLEYQLKLLKDREIEEQQNLNQIDKFFSDGIPINDNILALKNQFQKKKTDGENMLQNMTNIKDKNLSIIENLNKDLDKFNKEIENNEKLFDQKENEYTKFSDDLILKTIIEKNKKLKLDKLLREQFNNLKKINEKNLQIQREKEKERIEQPTKDEKEKFMLDNLIKKNNDLDDIIKENTEEVINLKNHLNNNPQILELEQENLELGGKILRIEKQVSIAKTKIGEMEMLLDQRARERENESQQKRDLINKIDMVKFRLDEASRMNDLVIQQKVKEKEEQEIKEVTKIIEEIKRKRNCYLEEIQYEQDLVDQMGHDKVIKQQEILSLQHDSDKLTKDLNDINENFISLTNNYYFFIIKDKDLSQKIDPLQAEINNFTGLIPSFETDIIKFKNQIQTMKQQIEFSKQIKNLNLDDVKVANSSNNQVNSNLLNFIKKFEEIQRMNNVNAKNLVK